MPRNESTFRSVTHPSHLRTAALTAVTLLAFAANSLLCRLALRSETMDPLSFTALRLVSGALILAPFAWRSTARWNPIAALSLGAYAVGFSLAYVTLEAGTGALLLFGAVQATMICAGVLRGERLGLKQTCGCAVALTGLVLLVLPGVRAPDWVGASCMIAAGIAWGVYSLLGRSSHAPAASTAHNFILAAPLSVLVMLVLRPSESSPLESSLSGSGALLAVLSGSVTSGLGYVLWYATLPGHSRMSAAIVQLAVPAIAALGGVALLDEALTPRLVVAGSATLAGIGLAITRD